MLTGLSLPPSDTDSAPCPRTVPSPPALPGHRHSAASGARPGVGTAPREQIRAAGTGGSPGSAPRHRVPGLCWVRGERPGSAPWERVSGASAGSAPRTRSRERAPPLTAAGDPSARPAPPTPLLPARTRPPRRDATAARSAMTSPTGLANRSARRTRPAPLVGWSPAPPRSRQRGGPG